MRYFARRLAHSLILLAGVSILTFLFAELAPGDFYTDLHADPRVSQQTVENLRARAGLGRPLPLRYVEWAAGALRGDFGYSLAYRTPVGPLLWQRARATLLLAGAATLLAWLIAVPLGIWSAARRGSWPDGFLKLILSVLLSIPDMLLAIAALLLVAESGWLPTGHAGLPVVVLVLGMLPVLVRHVRTGMLEAMESPFALSARAQGIPERRLLLRHLLPAALNPLISLFGLSLGALLGAALLVEIVMAWPGIGPLFLDAIMARDFPLVLAVEMMSAVFLISGNLIADLLLYRADPRIRLRS
jgi:peptide/nickel transport system permease protein